MSDLTSGSFRYVHSQFSIIPLNNFKFPWKYLNAICTLILSINNVLQIGK